MKPNQYQAAVAATYAGGEYAHIGQSDTWRDDIKTCGDTLFAFLMHELDEDVTDQPRLAISRLTRATGHLIAAMEAVMPLVEAAEDAQSQGGDTAG